jgi:uncharacterized protein YijF (DUF1287 family)
MGFAAVACAIAEAHDAAGEGEKTRMFDRRSLLLGLGATLALPGCSEARPAVQATARAARLIAAARSQVGVTLRYDSAYTRLAFPGGDVPRSKGVCTDVIVRAYRDAFGLDLQALVNSDMRRGFAAYPHLWGLARPDASIDHRRVPNLRTWLARKGAALPAPSSASGWRPGDIFTSLVGGSGTHIGLVSDRAGPRGWLIIHNIGAGAREEDALLDWPITGRYRWSID